VALRSAVRSPSPLVGRAGEGAVRKTERAKALRINSSPAERAMWRLLYPFRSDRFHFRKQVPIGQYFADIACHHAKLIIELDGDTHGAHTQIAHDQRRDAFLRAEGYTVLRFPNHEVLTNPEGVYAVVADALKGRPRNERGAAFRTAPSPALPTMGEGVSTALSVQAEGSVRSPSPLVGRAGEGAVQNSDPSEKST
jgi:very-short-patch-repair endonuclease